MAIEESAFYAPPPAQEIPQIPQEVLQAQATQKTALSSLNLATTPAIHAKNGTENSNKFRNLSGCLVALGLSTELAAYIAFMIKLGVIGMGLTPAGLALVGAAIILIGLLGLFLSHTVNKAHEPAIELYNDARNKAQEAFINCAITTELHTPETTLFKANVNHVSYASLVASNGNTPRNITDFCSEQLLPARATDPRPREKNVNPARRQAGARQVVQNATKQSNAQQKIITAETARIRTEKTAEFNQLFPRLV